MYRRLVSCVVNALLHSSCVNRKAPGGTPSVTPWPHTRQRHPHRKFLRKPWGYNGGARARALAAALGGGSLRHACGCVCGGSRPASRRAWPVHPYQLVDMLAARPAARRNGGGASKRKQAMDRLSDLGAITKLVKVRWADGTTPSVPKSVYGPLDAATQREVPKAAVTRYSGPVCHGCRGGGSAKGALIVRGRSFPNNSRTPARGATCAFRCRLCAAPARALTLPTITLAQARSSPPRTASA